MGCFRFLLALSVVAAHSSSGTLLGRHLLLAATAVQAFYIVSGFLITMVLNERKQYKNTFNFYLSRYLRLWPIYIVLAVLTFFFFSSSTLLADLASNGPIPTIFVIFSNLTLFCQDWFFWLEIDHGALRPTADYQTGSTPQLNTFLLIPQSWTLGVELTFYLLAPFLCRRPSGVAVLFLIGLAIRLAIGASNLPLDPWHYRFAPAEMMLFGAGGLSYFAGRFVQDRLPDSVRKFGPILCLATLVIYIVDVPYITSFLHHSLGKSFSSTLWLANPGFLVLVAIACPALFNRWRNVAWDGFLGELSFPIYISHTFVAEALRHMVPGELLTDSLLYVASVIAFSWALFVFVGRPVDRLRSSFGARVPNAQNLPGFTAAKNLVP
jgi:peptidoglycan/LPS O-acetylase OafA/YrhL